jgi:Na+-driven multidrug efflux pump
MNPSTSDLNSRRIFAFWMPLAVTWLIMSLEGPFLSAVIARMAEPKFNLAAYGVAFSIALLVEAPIIMILAAATTLVKDKDSFIKVRRFTYGMNGLITLVMVVMVSTPVFDFIARELLALPDPILHLTHTACILMIPWPAAIGYRRFYQGVLIRSNQTRYVAFGTGVRLAFMAAGAVALFLATPLAGASIGGAALSLGVIAEAVATRLMARGAVGALTKGSSQTTAQPLSYNAILSFYLPLALTTIIAIGVRPMVTLFVGQSRMAIESLAVLPVVHALTFLFLSLGLSYQEAAIALAGERLSNFRPLKNFALALGASMTLGLGVIAWTPLSAIWFERVSGLQTELAALATLPLQLLVPLPALWAFLSLQRAMLMVTRRTRPITTASALEVMVILAVLVLTVSHLGMVGAVAASVALLIGNASAPLWLLPSFTKALRMRS